MVQIKGVDVSPYQGTVDYQKVKADGNQFVFMKATEGTYYSHTDYFNNNAPLVLGAGLYLGAYHFARPKVGDAITQANYFLSVISSHKITYPAVLDLEVNDNNLSRADLTAWAVSFLKTVQNAGYFAMWYSYKSFVDEYLDITQLKDFGNWIADYGVNPNTPQEEVWQYSAAGHVNGVIGNVDQDISFVDFGTIIANMGKVKPQAVVEAVAPVKPLMTVKVLVQTDVRADPSHTSGYICDVHPGELYNVWEHTGDWHRIIVNPDRNITGWVDGNAGRNLYWVDNPSMQSITQSYIIQPGDSLEKIGVKFGKTVAQLQNMNGITDPNRILAGQKITV